MERFNALRERNIEAMGRSFEQWGRTVARRPRTVAGISFVVLLGFCGGLRTLQEETRSSYLWAPTRSRSYAQWQYLKDTFGEPGNRLVLYAQAVEENGNIFAYDALSELLKADKWTKEECATTLQGGQTILWDDVCEKHPKQTDCSSENFLQLWDYKQSDLKAGKGSIMDAVTALHNQVTVKSFAGTVELKSNGDGTETVKSARAVVLTYALNDVEGPSYEFEAAWNAGIAATVDPAKVTVAHFSARSYDDEVARLVSGDIPLFAAGIAIIVVYLSLTLGPIKSPVKSRALLGAAAVVNVLLSAGAGFGLTSLIGVKFVSIVSLLPLILLGVQVDGVIIMVDYLNAEPSELGIEERVARAMRSAGPAILITSLTAVSAFAVGTSTDLPAVTSFCAFATTSFFFALCVDFTFFLALLVLDERRMQARRVSCAPCFHATADTRVAAEDAAPAGEVPQAAHPGPARTLVQRIVADHYAPALTRPAVSAAVVMAFAAVAALSGAFVRDMELGLPDSDVLPDDSYVQDALRMEEEAFGGRLSTLDLVFKSDVDYKSAATRRAMHAAVRDVARQNLTIYVRPRWTHAYEDWLGGAPKTGYTDDLGEFLDTKRFTAFQEAVACPELGEGACTAPEATRFRLTMRKARKSVDAIKQRDLADSYLADQGFGDKAFAYSSEYIFAETDVAIWSLTLSNMGYALIAILVLMLVFTPPDVAAWITVCVALIDLDLLGVMVMLGVPLQSVSFVNLVMAIGLSVDYCVHISHTFADVRRRRSEEGSGEEASAALCAQEALATMGASVLKGGFTTFLGIVVISGASSVAFRTFFVMLSWTVALGMLHGVVLLPVLLTYGTAARRKPRAQYGDQALKPSPTDDADADAGDERPAAGEAAQRSGQEPATPSQSSKPFDLA